MDAVKASVGKAAAQLVGDGMLVGLGTGSTAAHFINHLIKRCREGLEITAVATSDRSFHQAKAGGIQMRNIEEITSIDITFDGADEIDPNKNMIKGGGGALLREKIVASMSHEMVVMVDESKLVEALGAFPLPVEIVSFAHRSTINKIQILGYDGALRKDQDGDTYITDNGNYIFDIHNNGPIVNPREMHHTLIDIPGVVETGLFFNLAGRVIVGYSHGNVEIRS